MIYSHLPPPDGGGQENHWVRYGEEGKSNLFIVQGMPENCPLSLIWWEIVSAKYCIKKISYAPCLGLRNIFHLQ